MISLDAYQDLLGPINHFLQCETPSEWVEEAKKPENLPTILIDHLLCELKAGQSAMYLIRKYAVDKESSHTLLDWFKPYENFAYRGIGSIETLKGKSNISKAIMAKSDSPYSQELIDKMVLLIKEELHHFYQVLEIMCSRGIEYENVTAALPRLPHPRRADRWQRHQRASRLFWPNRSTADLLKRQRL